MKWMLAFVLLFGLSFGAWAAPSPELFTAKIAVADESAQSVKKALPEAFAQVLAQVSDNPDLALQLTSTKNTPDLSSILQNYTFLRENNAQGQTTLFVQITFDHSAINEFLQKHGNRAEHTIANSPQLVHMQLDGINSLQDYIDALAALKTIPAVKKVSVDNTNGSQLMLSLEVSGGAQNLAESLSQNKSFSPENLSQVGLNYRWAKVS